MAGLPATVYFLDNFVTLPDERSFPDDIMFVPRCGHIVDKFMSSLPIFTMPCPAMEDDCMVIPDQNEPFLQVKLSSAACHGCGLTQGTRLYCSEHLRADYCLRCAKKSPTLCENEIDCTADPRRIQLNVRAEWKVAKVMKKSNTTVKVKWADWDGCTWEPRKNWQPRFLPKANIRVSTAQGPR